MSFVYSWVIGLSLVAPLAAPPSRTVDPAQLREMLYDRRHARSQSQAALLLVMDTSTEAAEVIRQGLQQSESAEAFHALTTALGLRRDARFNEELFAALIQGPTERRQSAADALAHLVDSKGVARLKTLATNPETESEVRRAAVLALGRSGKKAATAVLIELISGGAEAPRRDAIEVLTILTGHNIGTDTLRWQTWWAGRKDLSEQAWMEELFRYQASKSRRLEGELDRARAEVARMHQQLYSRLPAADRIGQVQTTANHEDPAVRALVVTWCTELLPGADAVGQRAVADVLLDLTRDGAVDVQRAAVLALGRVNDARACDRLRALLRQGAAPVRAAAARALTQQASLPRPEKPEITRAIQRTVVPALQKALEDPALEVVVEAAEDLGALGLPEAVPVLMGLLKHPSEPVRQTAAQALERVADTSVVEALLLALDDPGVGVRFSVVGALGHAAGDGKSLPLVMRARLFARLEDVLARDTDPGVRSRVATVFGECATPSALPALWKRAQAVEDSRVQEKAWAAFVVILARSSNLELLETWEKTIVEARQETRQLQLLAAVVEAWKKRGEASALLLPATEALVKAQLQQGKWAAAMPLTRELLAQPGSDTDLTRRLRWLLAAGEQALKEGNRAEALRAVQDARSFLPRGRNLAVEFERLEKDAQSK